MTKELENWLKEERAEAREEGRAEERAENEKRQEKEHVKFIQSIMQSANVNAEKAMEMLAIDKKLWPKYLAVINMQK